MKKPKTALQFMAAIAICTMFLQLPQASAQQTIQPPCRGFQRVIGFNGTNDADGWGNADFLVPGSAYPGVLVIRHVGARLQHKSPKPITLILQTEVKVATQGSTMSAVKIVSSLVNWRFPTTITEYVLGYYEHVMSHPVFIAAEPGTMVRFSLAPNYEGFVNGGGDGIMISGYLSDGNCRAP